MQGQNGNFQELDDQLLVYSNEQQLQLKQIGNSSRQLHKSIVPKLSYIPHKRQFRELATTIKKVKNVNYGNVILCGRGIFRSNFQSGNLFSVQLVDNVYLLQTSIQYNSNRQSSWFYFSCEGLQGDTQFAIRRFKKTTSLYNQGMKICVRETKDNRWKRVGTKITYQSIPNHKQTPQYQLKFHYYFHNRSCSVEFAYCFPYTYNRLCSFIKEIIPYVNYSVLTTTLDGRDIPLLTLGNPNSQHILVFSARVHPGQTVSSLVMEGFIRELINPGQFGSMILSNYLIKIVPMINPDGVVRGHYRFSAGGYDLNRKWSTCKQKLQPQIFYLRNLIRSLNKEKSVAMYIDMHGHSRKKNTFFYGCCPGSMGNQKAKQFPYLMSKLHDAFLYKNCSFSVQADKMGTARVCMWNELKIDYVYTLESTFCGPQSGGNYLEKDYMNIGAKLCQGIAVILYNPVKSILPFVPVELEKLFKYNNQLKSSLLGDNGLLQLGTDENDSGSDSNPEQGEISDELKKFEGVTQENSPTNKKQVGQNKMFSRAKVAEKAVRAKSNPRTLLRGIVASQFLEEQLQDRDNRNIKTANVVKPSKAHEEQTNELQLGMYFIKDRFSTKSGKRYRNSDKIRTRVISEELSDVAQQDFLKIQQIRKTLLHDQEGAQYRRVRNMTEKIKVEKPFRAGEGKGSVINGLNRQTEFKFTISKNVMNNSFYPRQRNRGWGMEQRRKGIDQHQKKFSINGDEMNVKCTGRSILI